MIDHILEFFENRKPPYENLNETLDNTYNPTFPNNYHYNNNNPYTTNIYTSIKICTQNPISNYTPCSSNNNYTKNQTCTLTDQIYKLIPNTKYKTTVNEPIDTNLTDTTIEIPLITKPTPPSNSITLINIKMKMNHT